MSISIIFKDELLLQITYDLITELEEEGSIKAREEAQQVTASMVAASKARDQSRNRGRELCNDDTAVNSEDTTICPYNDGIDNGNEAQQSEMYVEPRIWTERNEAAKIAAAEQPPPPPKKYEDMVVPPPAGTPKAPPPSMGTPQTKAPPDYSTSAAKKAAPKLGDNANNRIPTKAPPPDQRPLPPARQGPSPTPVFKSPPAAKTKLSTDCQDMITENEPVTQAEAAATATATAAVAVAVVAVPPAEPAWKAESTDWGNFCDAEIPPEEELVGSAFPPLLVFR